LKVGTVLAGSVEEMRAMYFIQVRNDQGLTVGGADFSALTGDYALLKVFFTDERLISRAKYRDSTPRPGGEIR
jgi:hypothetical protein